MNAAQLRKALVGVRGQILPGVTCSFILALPMGHTKGLKIVFAYFSMSKLWS